MSDTLIRLTKPQIFGLRRIRDRGPMAWDDGNKRKAAHTRLMFERLADEGLCTSFPYTITDAGRRAIDEADDG